jgi:hypothetical protein
MPLNRNLWPGRNAWVSDEPGEESSRSRHARRLAREAAIRRRRQLRGALARVRTLLRGRA